MGVGPGLKRCLGEEGKPPEVDIQPEVAKRPGQRLTQRLLSGGRDQHAIFKDALVAPDHPDGRAFFHHRLYGASAKAIDGEGGGARRIKHHVIQGIEGGVQVHLRAGRLPDRHVGTQLDALVPDGADVGLDGRWDAARGQRRHAEDGVFGKGVVVSGYQGYPVVEYAQVEAYFGSSGALRT